MRFRRVLMLALTAFMSVGAIAATVIKTSKAKPVSSISNTIATQAANAEVQGIIDGGKNPELISDRVAYLVLLRAIPDNSSDVSQRRARAYIRQILGKCSSCRGQEQSNGGQAVSSLDGDADIDAFLQIVEEFRQRVRVLDNQVEDIKRRNWPNPSSGIIDQLTQLQRQKETIVDEIITSLYSHINGEVIGQLRSYVNQHVKKQIKMIPSPSGPPGSPGWKRGVPASQHH